MSEIIDLETDTNYFPPKTVLVITESEAPSMCPEFDPNYGESYTTFFLVNLAEGTNKKITHKEAKELYNSPLGRTLSRRNRILFWSALKNYTHTGELVRTE